VKQREKKKEKVRGIRKETAERGREKEND